MCGAHIPVVQTLCPGGYDGGGYTWRPWRRGSGRLLCTRVRTSLSRESWDPEGQDPWDNDSSDEENVITEGGKDSGTPLDEN